MKLPLNPVLAFPTLAPWMVWMVRHLQLQISFESVVLNRKSLHLNEDCRNLLISEQRWFSIGLKINNNAKNKNIGSFNVTSR